MIRERGFGEWAFRVLMALILCLFAAAILYPLYFIVIASISDPLAVMNGKVFLWPKGIDFSGFRWIFRDNTVLMRYRNTLLYAGLGTAVNMLLTIPAAYALSRKDFMPRRILLFLFVLTMYFSGGLIPTYLLIKDLGLLNTPWVMIAAFPVNVTNLIIARSFFESTIPQELLDAAMIDGCSNTRFFLSIVLPLSKAILSVITLYYVVQHWNEYFNALIFLNKESLYPLQIYIRDLLIMNEGISASASSSSNVMTIAEQVKYGIIIVSTLPMLILFPFIQKYFIKGVMVGAVKG